MSKQKNTLKKTGKKIVMGAGYTSLIFAALIILALLTGAISVEYVKREKIQP